MISTYAAAAIFVAALALTYLICLRPMRQGRCPMTQPRPDARGEEIRRLREEIAQIRKDLAHPSA